MTTTTTKHFWEKHAAKYQTAFEKLPELADYVHRAEKRHLFRVLKPRGRVLDLGCGTGRWAFEFAPHCDYVLGVDFAEGMIRRAQEEAQRRQMRNVEFRVGSVESFRSEETFDIIILSGVLVYFPDDALAAVLQNVAAMLNPGGVVVSRETVGIHRRIEVQNEFHEKVEDAYSAIYRLPEEYETHFRAAGLELAYREDFTPLNFPMILYRRLVPARCKQAWLVRRLLQLGLWVQYGFDPLLLRWKWLYRPIQNRFWQIKSMLFLYRKSGER